MLTRASAGFAITGLVVAAVAALTPAAADAQIKASEAATFSQTIDGTTITLEYSRPSLRGRSIRGDLIGGQVRWGYVWTPGANAATKITSDQDFHLEGMPIPAGSYSVWMVVDPEEWTLVLDPDTDLYHTQGPSESEDQFRAPIQPDSLPYSVETLTWAMPEVRSDGATLRMQWGDLAVDLAVEVEPSVRVEMDAAQAAPYLGTWHVEQMANQYQDRHEFDLELRHEDSLLLGEMHFSPDFSMEVAFVEVADQVFRISQLMNGRVSEVNEFLTFEFVLDDQGRASSFESRSQDDDLVHRATRR